VFTLLSAGFIALMAAFYWFGLVATAVATGLYAASVVFFSRCLDAGCAKPGGCRSCLAGAVLVSSIIAFLTVLHAAHLALP
jgi:hypothetical protein